MCELELPLGKLPTSQSPSKLQTPFLYKYLPLFNESNSGRPSGTSRPSDVYSGRILTKRSHLSATKTAADCKKLQRPLQSAARQCGNCVFAVVDLKL